MQQGSSGKCTFIWVPLIWRNNYSTSRMYYNLQLFASSQWDLYYTTSIICIGSCVDMYHLDSSALVFRDCVLCILSSLLRYSCNATSLLMQYLYFWRWCISSISQKTGQWDLLDEDEGNASSILCNCQLELHASL